MTPAERDEVLRIAAGFFACEPKDALTMAGMIKLCNAVLRYVPPGDAADIEVSRSFDAVVIDIREGSAYSPAGARSLAHALHAAADAAEES